MQLREFFDKNCIHVTLWAKKHGIPVNWIYSIMQGRDVCISTAGAIVKATEGQVSWLDLYESAKKGKRSSASKVERKGKKVAKNKQEG